MPKDHLNCGNVASRTALLCTAVATFCWSAPAHGQTSRGDRKLIAFTKCTLLYMGEAYCQRELEKHLGRTLGGLTCAAYIQKTFEGRIDLSDIGWGLLADKATSSKSGWIRLGGLIGKGLLFRKCYRQTLAELEEILAPAGAIDS